MKARIVISGDRIRDSLKTIKTTASGRFWYPRNKMSR
jgi:hypothetical protein